MLKHDREKKRFGCFWVSVLLCFQLSHWGMSGFFYRSGIPNGQPKLLLSLIPDYPLLNFLLTTTIFILVSSNVKVIFIQEKIIKTIFTTWLILQISYRVFKLTNRLKEAFIPTSDNNSLYQNFIAGIAIFVALYFCSFIIDKIPIV